MMSKNSDNLSKLISAYGLDDEQVALYIELLQTGLMSALQLSRATKVPRSSVYRKLDELVEKGLLIEREGAHGTLFATSGVAGFEQVIARRDQKLAELKLSLVDVEERISEFAPKQSNLPQVSVYQGVRGIEQILWNQLNASNTVYVFETGEMSKYVSQKYGERIRREFVTRKLQMKVLTNESEIGDFSHELEFIQNHWEIKYIDPKIFTIESELFLHNNSLSHFSLDEQGLFGVEVVDDNLAKYQQNLFKLLWTQANSMIRISAEGRSKFMPKP